MRNLNLGFLGICVAIFLACTLVPAKSKRAFTQNGFCYDHNLTNVSQGRFKINGYYELSDYSKRIFYDDGIWVNGYEKNCTYPDNKSSGHYINGISHWGIYKIIGDTVKVRFIQTMQYPYDGGEQWYLIVDSTRLNFLFFKFDLPVTNYDLELSKRQFPNGRVFTFVPYDSLPDLNKSWFKQSKWLWCDKVAYEKWKASQ